VAIITVAHEDRSDYLVIVEEGGRHTSHVVTVWPSDVDRYAPGATPEALLEASFEFLLAREPKEAIMPRFELPLIERYFPEYPSVIHGMTDAPGDRR
jgi:hypothetical protein